MRSIRIKKLFLILNDVEQHFFQRVNSVSLVNDITFLAPLFQLLFCYADEVVIFATFPEDLQNSLNAFVEYCNTWKLAINKANLKLLYSVVKIQKLNFTSIKLLTVINIRELLFLRLVH